MVFSSILFLFCFLPIFLIVYHLVGKRLKNLTILIFSIAFYAWGAPQFVYVLLTSLLVNFFIVQEMNRNESRKKLFLYLSLFINVGLLLYFKYTNFFIENFNVLLTKFNVENVTWTKIALPLGISFFTFQSITYTVDVYRKVHEPLKRVGDYLLYILMFPQLIAGPIVRFNTIAGDIIDREKKETANEKLNGIYIFIVGLSKKVLIANVLGEYVDSVFDNAILDENSVILWLTFIAYSFQIYFDFSGYSDMAIGLGKMMGFTFPENFNNPYISQNITEFWRRWHITLGDWMKEYLYIPLGGNRVKNKSRLYFNLILVFLISGFWHGAEWTFIFWGAWHGLFLILDRIFLIKWLEKAGKFTRIILTYIVVIIGWVFFRADDMPQAFSIVQKMFSFDFSGFSQNWDNQFIIILILAFVLSFSNAFSIGKKGMSLIYSEKNSVSGHLVYFSFAAVFLLICASYITASGFNPFIYFRF